MSIIDDINNNMFLTTLLNPPGSTPIVDDVGNIDNSFEWLRFEGNIYGDHKISTAKSHFYLLCVKKFSNIESNEIAYSIESGDIIFTDDGHIANLPSGNLINRAFSNLDRRRRNIIFGPDKRLKKINKDWNKIFYYNKKILFSPGLRWILYRVNDKYKLLYNPVHRKPFKDLYEKLLDQNRDNNPFTVSVGNLSFQQKMQMDHLA